MGGMQIVDLKDPAKPEMLSTWTTNDFVRRVIVKDNLAYLAERDAGIRIVDVTDPTKSRPAGHLQYLRRSLGYCRER